ncbi:hypothetical protein LC085_10020 [Bacillus tianshenii]|uniref:hypothetical protein n=1 Tax=Sutcliffiella tianshenii TaxID=1463404 RepID=UPI001CD45D87|nr:hypothetical protein [Bacillus tianshenii]MCA1320242.1 hypothetical protein [Bacillus tianshenii]
MSRKLRYVGIPVAVVLMGGLLVGCGGKDDEVSEAGGTVEVEAAEVVEIEANKHGVDVTVVRQVEDAILNKFRLLDEGDYEGYLATVDVEKDDDLLSLIQDMIQADTISSVDNIEVMYHKDDEVLVVYDLNLMTEEFNPDMNFNRNATSYAILHRVDDGWKFIVDHAVSLTVLDGEGQPDKNFDYMNYDTKMAWWAERKRLVGLGLVPSEWFEEVLREQFDHAAASIDDQPLQITQEERDLFAPGAVEQVQAVLNGLGPPVEDTITLEALNFYPEELQNGVFMFGSFIRNGFDHPVSGLVAEVSVWVRQPDESGRLVDVLIGEGEFDLSDIGTIEAGNSVLMTLFLDGESLLVDGLEEMEIDGFEVEAEFWYEGE